VKEYNNQKELSMGYCSTYEVEPDLERVKELISWSRERLTHLSTQTHRQGEHKADER
jgi:hypothetical protein